ncbi:hypothetical protein AB4152_14385 [Vibrio breoganii]|uniref:hypothetical protein n=1 Tax=Vibrio breoganii TaxID=553239 RepID=UPI000C84BE6F|nr:hypothetical protein [Vibrio breoganii]PML19601.1 hypothetical protein BCT84_18500 [Vibrio breoganii]PML37073.1 hypothetical protein BCT78_08710 [Vibrio breoganii]
MLKERKNFSLIGMIFILLAPVSLAQEIVTKADEEKLTECASVSLWRNSGKSINKGNLPDKTVKVPEGWVVVGGGYDSQYSEPIMVICRKSYNKASKPTP